MTDPRILTVRPEPGEYACAAGTWTRPRCGPASLDAYQFATQAVQSPLANVCDTNYTCVARLRKDRLPKRETYRGLHARLCETSGGLRR
jgi:hypothetical protein